MSRLDEILREMESLPTFSGIGLPIGVNTPGNFNEYPIHIAAFRGDCEAIRLLVAAGADVNQRGEHGFSPLHEATLAGHLPAVILLVELGTKPSLTDDGLAVSAIADEGGKLTAWLKEKGY